MNQQVTELAERHKETWRNRPPAHWYAQFVEEVGQLGAALIRKDETAVTLQLQVLASICLNWLDMRGE